MTILFSENFNGNSGSPLFSTNGTFNGSGFNATPGTGQLDSDFWRVAGFSDLSGLLDYGGTASTGDYARGTLSGDPTTAGVYAVNTGIAALGASSFIIQPTGAEFGTTPGTITLRVQYQGATALTGFSFDYDAVFRNNAGRESFANFSWAVQSAATQPTTFSSTVAALSYTTPVAADALGWQRTDFAAQTFNTTVNAGDYIFLRWTIGDGPGGSGSRDELGFDNLVLTGIDGAGGPTISVGPTSVSQAEGNTGTTPYTYTLTRSDTSADTGVTVTITAGPGLADAEISSVTVDGVAVAGFSFGTGFVVPITGSATTAEIVINVLGDTVTEANETFTVTLSSPTAGYALGTASATGTIQNDDFTAPTPTHQIADIQGTAHISSFVTGLNSASTAVVTLEGIVTARDTDGFYIQDDTPDTNIRTSEAIFVYTGAAAAASITVGERVFATGKVYEFQNFNNLPQTQLVGVSSSGATRSGVTAGDIFETNTVGGLPFGEIGGTATGRLLPAVTATNSDNYNGGLANPFNLDANGRFVDGTDFWESVESMNVTLNDAVVADGFWYSFNAFYAYSATGSETATSVNSRGGLTMSGGPGYDPVLGVAGGGQFVDNGDINPERIQIDFSESWNPGFGSLNTEIDMGDQFVNVTGIIKMDFANWKLFATETPVFAVGGNAASGPSPEVTTLTADSRSLKVASFNVENLDPTDDTTLDEGVAGGTGKFNDLARAFANNLGSPDVLMVSEVQDNNGPGGSPTTNVDASLTWTRLTQAIRAETGKNYVWVDELPDANAEGGQQTGNIRVGFIYDADKVQLGTGAFTEAAFSGYGAGATQAQVDAAAAANATAALSRRTWTDRIGDGERDVGDAISFSDADLGAEIVTADWAGTRKSLMGEFTFNGQSLFLTANHWPSKGGSGAQYRFNPNNLNEDGANADWQARKDIAQDLWSMSEFIRSQAGFGDSKFVLGGDLNEFYFFDPLRVLEGYIDADGNARAGGPTFLNLTTTLPESERFSYTFDGNSQALDHIVIDTRLASSTQYDIVHINTGYNSVRTNAPDRAISDHDPTVAVTDFREFSERLNGTAGADVMAGFGGNDTLNGGAGADAFDGGAGIDTVSYAGSTTHVVVGLLGWTNFEAATGETLTNIENIIGTDFIDFIGGDDGANRLEGGLLGDALYGYRGDDRLIGGDGDDNLFGMAGADTLDGGAGADTARYDWATSSVIAGLDGSGWNNFGEAAGDSYVSVEGILGSTFADAFGGNGDDNWIYGAGGNDTVYSYLGVDWLYGEVGDDLLDGGADNDLVVGGEGFDILVGGDGADTFAWSAGDGSDFITDFSTVSGDVIRLVGSGFTSFAQLQGAITQTAGQPQSEINLGGGQILYVFGVTPGQFSADDFLFA